MPVQELLESLTQRLGSSASVKSIFGEPVTAGDRTIIPVARIGYGFGGGGGTAKEGAAGEGGGAGGGAGAKPVGIVEIAPEGTRFIPFHETRRLAVTALAGFAAGLLLAWRWR